MNLRWSRRLLPTTAYSDEDVFCDCECKGSIAESDTRSGAFVVLVTIGALVERCRVFANHVVKASPQCAHTLEFLANTNDAFEVPVQLIHICYDTFHGLPLVRHTRTQAFVLALLKPPD